MKLSDVTPGYYIYKSCDGTYSILEADKYLKDRGIYDFRIGSENYGEMDQETANLLICKLDMDRLIQEVEQDKDND